MSVEGNATQRVCLAIHYSTLHKYPYQIRYVTSAGKLGALVEDLLEGTPVEGRGGRWG